VQTDRDVEDFLDNYLEGVCFACPGVGSRWIDVNVGVHEALEYQAFQEPDREDPST
jgi:hypothetical protein